MPKVRSISEESAVIPGAGTEGILLMQSYPSDGRESPIVLIEDIEEVEFDTEGDILFWNVCSTITFLPSTSEDSSSNANANRISTSILLSLLRIHVSLMEEIDLFLADDGSITTRYESDDDDSLKDCGRNIPHPLATRWGSNLRSLYFLGIWLCRDISLGKKGSEISTKKTETKPNDKTEHGNGKRLWQNQGQKMQVQSQLQKNQQSKEAWN
ncbi:hypothetical protein Tco_1549078 [Tanacetum coccineum]